MSYINQDVQVESFYFLSCLGDLKSFPKIINFNNQRYIFSDGLQYLVRIGERIIRIFEMSDGDKTYRLRLENNQWTLVGTK